MAKWKPIREMGLDFPDAPYPDLETDPVPDEDEEFLASLDDEVAPEYRGGMSVHPDRVPPGTPPFPVRGTPTPAHVRVPLMARGGALEAWCRDAIGNDSLRFDIRSLTFAYLRAMYRDPRCRAEVRDLLKEYILGPE